MHQKHAGDAPLVWFQVFILSLTRLDKFSFRGRIFMNFIINRQFLWLFWRLTLSSNLCYDHISPHSYAFIPVFTDSILFYILQ